MHARRSSFHHFPFVRRCGLQVEIVPSVPTDELRKRCCVSPLLKSKVVWLYLVKNLNFYANFHSQLENENALKENERDQTNEQGS